jgi:thioredoxin-related protein
MDDQQFQLGKDAHLRRREREDDMIGSAVKQGLRVLAASAVLALAGPALAEVPMGDDGLHKPDWLKETFLDLREDLADANAEGKRMLIIIEQRGCIYCTRLHEKVLPDPRIDAMIRENFFVVQINLYGDLDVTDFDGTVLSEKDMARRWNTVFTPTMIFLPEEVPEDTMAVRAASAVMPGAFERNTTLAMFTWVHDKEYDNIEFQRYFAENFYVAE